MFVGLWITVDLCQIYTQLFRRAILAVKLIRVDDLFSLGRPIDPCQGLIWLVLSCLVVHLETRHA